MKPHTLLLAATLAALTSIGCKPKPLLPQDPASEGKDYLGALEKNRERMQLIRNRDKLNNAIRHYLSVMGTTPSNLTALVKSGYIDQIPDAPEGLQYIYENHKGNVRLARLTPQQKSQLAQQKIQTQLQLKGGATKKDTTEKPLNQPTE